MKKENNEPRDPQPLSNFEKKKSNPTSNVTILISSRQ